MRWKPPRTWRRGGQPASSEPPFARVRRALPPGFLLTSTDTAQSEGPSGYREAVELELDGATKRYPGAERPAVDHLSLTVPAGEICVLVGPSGCGKTTAMRMVNRMTDITEGDIR